MILIENDNVRLQYHPRTKIIHHEIRRFVHGSEFRDVLEKGLEVFAKHRACKWLSDDRGNGPLKVEDSTWALEDWAPRVIAAGWRFWGVVMPEKVLGQMNMKRWIATYAERGVTVSAFTEPLPAMSWLEQQKR
jgi:hypothetical protein